MPSIPATPSSPDNFPRPLRTLVVDDSVELLAGLTAYLKAEPLFHVVGTAVDGQDALRLAKRHKPDLILMDLHMPVMNGLKATAALRRDAPETRIIIMTMDYLASAEVEARAQGAHGFILKTQILSEHFMTELRRAFQPDGKSTT